MCFQYIGKGNFENALKKASDPNRSPELISNRNPDPATTRISLVSEKLSMYWGEGGVDRSYNNFLHEIFPDFHTLLQVYVIDAVKASAVEGYLSGHGIRLFVLSYLLYLARYLELERQSGRYLGHCNATNLPSIL